ncbi:pentapeptide repeat-containing protein [Prauserella endophytica]|uniref:Pentapeptide repeat-containing protein n=1 Tax=Prauserella endophytica TaxID=1592324 RepID=A0ABY2RUY0_9PSEU|nr:pentapeptide repeat-containing protein [Prauserella endophytica]TKG61520.1 pentapeptide repeat-containing protein [Prauserella endophytica]
MTLNPLPVLRKLASRHQLDREVERLRPISAWMLIPSVVLVALVTVVVLFALGDVARSDPSATVRVDVIRIALTAAAGTGGGLALLLAFRRQRSTEIAAAHSISDAAERRVTELYTKAVEQLGSEQAPVRLGGLYALERLAQDNPDHRQTIVNVLCAYIRMSSTTSLHFPASSGSQRRNAPSRRPNRLAGADRLETTGHRIARSQEREVRMTAGHILLSHLQSPDAENVLGAAPPGDFWPDIDINMAGASVSEFNFSQCQVRSADFSNATIRQSSFRGMEFDGFANFTRATFTGGVGFDDAVFYSAVSFIGTTFEEDVHFRQAEFYDFVLFEDARFQSDASFELVDFDYVRMVGVDFAGTVSFRDAEFRSVTFEKVTFRGEVGFTDAVFDAATFRNVAFEGAIDFRDAKFETEAKLDRVHIRTGGIGGIGGIGASQTLLPATWVRGPFDLQNEDPDYPFRDWDTLKLAKPREESENSP